MLSLLQRLFLVVALVGGLLAVILGIGVAAGAILHWLVPSIELGTASLCGLIAMGILAFAGCQAIIPGMAIRDSNEDENYDEDEFDQDVLTAEQVEAMSDQLTEAVLTRIRAASEWQSASTKRRR